MNSGGLLQERREPRQWARLLSPRASSAPSRGQALAEFALIAPILLLIVVAIADFGRLYNSMVAIESAAREAADYGTFKSSYWDPFTAPPNPPVTFAEMERRACTAAWGSHLEGYSEPPGTVNHATCDNPVVTCAVEPNGPPAQDCASYDGAGDCHDSTTDPPCVVHVSASFTFRPFFNFNLFGWTPLEVTFSRESLFRVSDLPVP
ncbi:MAG: pilus assembly protein [Chloroflexi bacterium]|nr:pilus assembly protein [Chloroflexota bacterium]